ncbi:ATP-binding cassette domain-containing protein [Nocardioides sp. B-3]|uniref:ATP-binding cassette domain-containing protein n=1 Tax=Nocardioides sp. B-3 TaxID=2895565 RepID=UPI002152226C|nr:ATP-binding cassette domain-containing protein [Nocardioides sp. B-3]UUZ58763.1 ATP-binding cassette domain-containing protein [Nocardioides sp. B-3]
MTLVERPVLTEAVIETHKLVKRFGRTTAVGYVTLDLSGGVIGVPGPNGAGKTTLLRLLATVPAPDSGELRLLGFDPRLARERVLVRRQLGFLPQSPRLYPAFTPLELIDYVAVLKEHTDRRRRYVEATRVPGSGGPPGPDAPQDPHAVGWHAPARGARHRAPRRPGAPRA